jgi:DNA-directed RNA polymerase specialized sigma24 family protein
LDRERWECEVAAHYAHVLRGLYAVAGRREQAEDALHDALLAAMAPGMIEGIDRTDAWLYAVGVRKLRRSAWRRRLDVLLRTNVGSYPEPGLARIEALEALRVLTPRQRELVVARFYLDLSFKEIAAHFGITVGAATSTVSQALARMRGRADRSAEGEWTGAK